MYKRKGIGGIHDTFSIIKPTKEHKKETLVTSDSQIGNTSSTVDIGKGPIMVSRKRKTPQVTPARKIKKKKNPTTKKKKPKTKGVKKKGQANKRRLKDRF